MARPIPYDSSFTGWQSARGGRQVFRGLIAGLIISVLISGGVWALSAGNDMDKRGAETNVLAQFCQWLYDTKIGSGIRESIWVFPIIEGTHLLGIALSVGMLCWFDLRLLGLALRDQPVSKVWQQVMPVRSEEHTSELESLRHRV